MAQPMMDASNMQKVQFHSYAFHFLFSGAKGCLLPYLTIYFRVLGLTATQVGFVMGIGAFVTMISSVCCTGCATKCNKRRLLLVGSTFTLFLSYLVLMVLPPISNKGALQFCTNSMEVTLNPENQSLLALINSTDELESDIDQTTTGESASLTTTEILHLNTTTTTVRPSLPPSTTETTTETPKFNVYSDLTERDLALLNRLGIDVKDLEGLSEDDITQIINQIIAGMEQNPGVSSEPASSVIKERRSHGRHSHSRIERTVRAEEIPTNLSTSESETSESSTVNNNMTLVTSMWQKIYRLQQQLSELRNQVFTSVLGIIIIASLFGSPVERVSDDIWFDFLDNSEMIEKYGQHRSWAALGMLFFPIIPAVIVVNTPCLLFGKVLNIKVHFFAFSAMMLCTFISTFLYPIFRERRKVHRKMLLSRGFKILFADCHAVVYSFSLIAVGVIDALLGNFLFWRIQDLGGSELVMGSAIAVAASGQIVMYVMYRWLVCKMSHGGAVVFGLLILGTCLIFYSFAWMPWLLVPGEFFRSLATTLIWNAVMLYPDFRLNPFVMDRSALSVVSALHLGFGVAGGSMLSGYMADMFSLRIVFQGGCAFIVAWALLLTICLKCVVKKAKIRYSKLLQDDDSESEDESASFDEDDWLEIALKHQK